MATNFEPRTKDLEKAELEKLRSVFPECFVEDKLNIDKLLTMVGEHCLDDFEKYEFRWKGKSESLLVAQQRSMATLRPCVEESVDFDNTQNLYIEGDNLESMRLLMKSYHRRVKMIYIDPPYNTGADFVYKDDWTDSIGNYKRITEQELKSNAESSGRYHTDWLNMMYPRLLMAKRLLRDDGVIFISIDDNEVHNLRKVCDEVFGEDNFLATITRRTKSGGGSAAHHFAVEHDYIVVYCRNKSSLPPLNIPFEDNYKKRYAESDEYGRYFWDTMERSSTATTPYIITAPDGQKLTGKWFRSEERFLNDLKTGEVRFLKKPDGSWSVQFKQRMAEGRKIRTIMGDNEFKSSQDDLESLEMLDYFDWPKTTYLLTHFMRAIKGDKDIILDFFSGSATTAHAVMQLNSEDGGNRRFVMIQLPEKCAADSEAYKAGYKNICEIGKERIRRAGAKILAEQDKQINLGEAGGEERKPLDVGFRVFKLDTSNIKRWDTTPINRPTAEQTDLFMQRLNDMIDSVKHDRTNLDIVFEVLLKLGNDLSEPVSPIEISDGSSNPTVTAYAIGADCRFMVCLDEGVTVEHAEQMAEYAPGVIVFGDRCFADTTALANVDLALKDMGIDIQII